MFKIVVFGIAIGLASGQNFKQIQHFPAQLFQQHEVQPEVHIQPQQNPAASAFNDEVSRNFRDSVAQSVRDNLAHRNAPTNSVPVEPLDDQIVEINNTPLVRKQNIARSRLRPQRPRIHDRFTEIESEFENIPAVRPVQPVQPAQPIQRQPQRNPDVPIRSQAVNDEETAQYLRKQAENAHYTFDSSVQDTINDQAITRSETRDGLALTGMYSYSDGFFRRTVHYEADQNGYRVTKEEIEPIGNGPQYNPAGKADVSSSLIGGYSITADDVRDTRVKDPVRPHEIVDDEIRINKAPMRKHRFESGRV